jgi:hypothetical protein
MCLWRVMRLSRCAVAAQLLVADELVHLRVHVGTSGELARPPGLVGTSNLARARDPALLHPMLTGSQLGICIPLCRMPP